MKKRIIAILLTTVMSVGLLAGCGGNDSSTADEKTAGEENETAEEESGDTTAQLSAADYDFEKEYMFGDFNDHSNNDSERQGVDTFEDTDIVFEDINYEQFLHLLQQEGNYLIQLSGTWCHNSRALSPYSNELAKEYGIDTIYMYDFDFDNNEDGSTFLRMTNGVDTIGAKYNYFYGEVVSRYLTNLNDWVQYPADTEAAITYTNAAGEDVTVARLQEPYLFLYNKDNTVDNSESGNGSTSCPIVYAFEEMIDRDAKGAYTKEYDEEGNEVTDDDGNAIKTYITEEYKERLQKIFDYIKDNNVELSEYSKTDYIRKSFNSCGTEIFSADEQINIYPVTYRQLEWLVNQDGNSLILFGGAWSENTRTAISAINEYAIKNNLTIYLCDTMMDSNYTIDQWSYTQSTSITNEDAPIIGMYTHLLESYFTNLEAANTLTDGTPQITDPYLLSYNKAAADEDGFAAPVTSYCEIGSSVDESGISAVLQSYGEHAEIEIQE